MLSWPLFFPSCGWGHKSVQKCSGSAWMTEWRRASGSGATAPPTSNIFRMWMWSEGRVKITYFHSHVHECGWWTPISVSGCWASPITGATSQEKTVVRWSDTTTGTGATTTATTRGNISASTSTVSVGSRSQANASSCGRNNSVFLQPILGRSATWPLAGVSSAPTATNWRQTPGRAGQRPGTTAWRKGGTWCPFCRHRRSSTSPQFWTLPILTSGLAFPHWWGWPRPGWRVLFSVSASSLLMEAVLLLLFTRNATRFHVKCKLGAVSSPGLTHNRTLT